MRKLRRFLRGRLFLCALIALLCLLALIALAVWLPRALAPIAVLERLFSFVCALIVLADGTPSEHKTSKLALILFLPWTGAIVCLIFLSRAPKRTVLRGDVPAAEAPWQAEVLANTLCSLAPCKAKTAEYFSVGREMYERLLSDLTGAKKRIWLEYYIIGEGVFWSDTLAILAQKAAQGVDVRLIYDDFGCSLTLPHDFCTQMRTRGIKVYPFRPVRLSRAAGRRDHRKIAVVDDVAYTGGINLSDEYIGETIRFGHWKDTAVRLTGQAVTRFAELFCRTWNGGNADTVCPFSVKGGNIPCAVFADSAAETELRAGAYLFPLFYSAAKRTLYVNTPYLSLDRPLMQSLKTAALSGVDVRLMIPEIPDKKLPYLLTKSYARELERAGVQVRRYAAGFLHAKSACADGEFCYIGSYNLDFRSLYLQAECGVLLKDAALAQTLERDFLSAWESGTPMKRASLPERVFSEILRLIAPLM